MGFALFELEVGPSGARSSQDGRVGAQVERRHQSPPHSSSRQDYSQSDLPQEIRIVVTFSLTVHQVHVQYVGDRYTYCMYRKSSNKRPPFE